MAPQSSVIQEIAAPVLPTVGALNKQMFDVGVNDPLPPTQFLILGLQNVFGMTGMFVFPGILGRAYGLPAEQIAYLYGVTFMVCGLITIFQSVLLLRLPIIQGPYAGTFAALLSTGHLPGANLGTAFGSLCVASLIFCALTIPIRGMSVIGLFVRHLRSPLLSGMMVLLTTIQVSTVAFPGWLGLRTSPGFPVLNLAAGAMALATLIVVMLWGGSKFRRGAVLAGLAVGTLFYAAVQHISFSAVVNAPLLIAPEWFPFGFGVRADFVLVFLLTLIPATLATVALYQMVADWGNEPLPSNRISEGLFAMSVGAVLAGITGGVSTMAYPDCIGMLRSTRVCSRYATLAAGLILILLGSCIKFDMLLVIVPLPVLSASATLLFGIVFMHGLQMLSRVEWNERTLISGGLALLIALGGILVSADTMQTLPFFARLLMEQPIISGGLTLIILSALLGATAPVANAGAEATGH
jgi:xanthine/uracil permease